MIFRKASLDDIKDIGQLYDDTCDYLENNINYCAWKKGIYPTDEDAMDAIAEGCLYVAELDSKIVGTVILRHKPEDGYEMIQWKKDISYEKVYVIYTFAVSPLYRNKGIASKILQAVKELGKEEGMEALRLDVAELNTPAIKLYEKEGFICMGKADLGYGKYGLDWFYLYENVLL